MARVRLTKKIASDIANINNSSEAAVQISDISVTEEDKKRYLEYLAANQKSIEKFERAYEAAYNSQAQRFGLQRIGRSRGYAHRIKAAKQAKKG